MPLGYKKED